MSSVDSTLCIASHQVGKITLMVTNSGILGNPLGDQNGLDFVNDCITGLPLSLRCEFPKRSRVEHLFDAGLWVGGLVGTDTLVSTGVDSWGEALNGREYYPDAGPAGSMSYRSIIDPRSPDYLGAISEEDLIAAYTDTLTTTAPEPSYDYFRKSGHIPLFVEVTQRSYAWSYAYAEDFVLFDLSIKNIGKSRIQNAFVGLYVDGDVGWADKLDSFIYTDDISGFLRDAPSQAGCGFEDTLNLAWTADNDGDPVDGAFIGGGIIEGKPCTSVLGLRILSEIQPYEWLSFNWWVSDDDPTRDFGPRARSVPGRPYRDFRTGGLGTPKGDVNKYYLLSNGEIDYDQARTATVDPTDPDWMYPDPSIAEELAEGADTKYLLSVGPSYVEPGQAIPFAFAFVAGENFHTDPNNLQRLKDLDVPGYYAHLDFSDLVKNAQWASWIYDNPGVDTDGDGYAGKTRICVLDSELVDGNWIPTAAETTYYTGDGIPDWRAASPPPPPKVWLYPTLNGIKVRFNGKLSETTKDIFSKVIDFEGYRIYFGRDEREQSLSLAASYDRLDFDKYIWDIHHQPDPGWSLLDEPYSLEQLRCSYGSGTDPCQDSTFDPLTYTIVQPYYHPQFADSVFFFRPHDYNSSMPGVNTPIRKIYPDEPYPDFSDSTKPGQLTEDGYFKYFEYEFEINNLLPTVPYYVNVTAFDYGDPGSGLQALETSKTLDVQHAYPLADENQVDNKNLKVYIYPNPYRINGGYRASGFEGRTRQDRPDDRVRAINFANLPAKCTICIWTLDGDMVRCLDHDMDPSDPNSSHDS